MLCQKKYQDMRSTVLFLLANFLVCLLPAAPIQGYIITKDNLRLTGSIGQIENSREDNNVIYINDFGSRYRLSPELIKGFVFIIEGQEVVYECRKGEDFWYFLRVLSRGEGMTLYADPLDGIQAFEEAEEISFEKAIDHSYRYYLQVRRRTPFKVKRLGFRKQIRPLLRRRAPELADKIGQPGYRYRDLQKIIDAYNDSYRKTRTII